MFKFLKPVVSFCSKNGNTICAVGSFVGVLVTAYFSGKAALKLDQIQTGKEYCEATEQEYDKKKYRKDVVKAAAPAATAIFCTGAFIFAGWKYNRDYAAMLTGVAIAAQRKLINFENVVKDEVGDEKFLELKEKAKEYEIKDTKKEILAPIFEEDLKEDEFWFMTPIAPHECFKATKSEVIKAAYDLNHKICSEGKAVYADLLNSYGLDADWESSAFGWSRISGEYYGYDWVDFSYNKHEVIDEKTGEMHEYFEIVMSPMPIGDYEDPYDLPF